MRTFDTVEALRQALLEFRETYNATWLIKRHGFITPIAAKPAHLPQVLRIHGADAMKRSAAARP